MATIFDTQWTNICQHAGNRASDEINKEFLQKRYDTHSRVRVKITRTETAKDNKNASERSKRCRMNIKYRPKDLNITVVSNFKITIYTRKLHVEMLFTPSWHKGFEARFWQLIDVEAECLWDATVSVSGVADAKSTDEINATRKLAKWLGFCA